MGTAKRERQKVNRQLRLQELAKEQRKEKSRRVGLRIGLVIAGVVALVGVVYLLNGGDDGPSTSVPTSTLPATTTIDPNLPTTTAPPKPEVSVPGANVDELKVTTITAGTGEAAKVGDTLEVHYIGVLSTDGTEFDNSYDRGQPIPVTLGDGGVIEGWEQGLVGTQTGGRYQIDIPSDLAYGDTGREGIPGGASLTFVVDIMSITPGTAPSTTTADTATATS